MITLPEFSPSFLTLGPLEFRYYGLMYAFTFIIGFFVLQHLLKTKRFSDLKISHENIYDLLLYVMIGVILGGRLGYILLYNASYYLENPLQMLFFWEGGMSFHGGLLGVVIAGLFFAKRKNIHPYDLADLLVILVPIGLGLGRIGNFINMELYGRVSNLPWCVQFPQIFGCRHPSQIYEFLLEGVLLFAIMWFLKDKIKKRGTLFWIFIGLYGIFRFILEFFREPDIQIGLLTSFHLSMGQILSIPMIFIASIILILPLLKKKLS